LAYLLPFRAPKYFPDHHQKNQGFSSPDQEVCDCVVPPHSHTLLPFPRHTHKALRFQMKELQAALDPFFRHRDVAWMQPGYFDGHPLHPKSENGNH